MLVLLYFSMLRPARRSSSARFAGKEKKSAYVPVAYNLFIDKFRGIDSQLNSLLTKTDISELKKDIEILKKCISDIESDMLDKVRIKQEEKDELKAIILKFNNKIDTIAGHLSEDETKLLSEKEVLEMKIAQAQDREKLEIEKYNSEVQELKNTANSFDSKYKNLDLSAIDTEIKKLYDELISLKEKHELNAIKNNEAIDSKTRDINVSEKELLNTKDERIDKINALKRKNDSLNTEILSLKKTYDSLIQNNLSIKQNLEKELGQLQSNLSVIEKENHKVKHLLEEKELLGKNINDLNSQLKRQSEVFNGEITAKNEELKRLSSEAQEKEDSIQKSYIEEEAKLSFEQKELEAEIQRVKQQLEKAKSTGSLTQSSLKSETEKLQAEFKQKESKYQNFKKERIFKEKDVHEKLKKQLDELKKNIEDKTKDYKTDLKARDEQIYLLRTRLGIREDKLKTDIERRRKTQQTVLGELKNTSDGLRKAIEKKSAEVNQQAEIVSKRIDSLKEEVLSVNENIRQEEVLSEKLESARKKIEQEILIVDDKLNKELAEMQDFIVLKNKQIRALSEEIIEKERLLKIEHTALGKVVDINYKHKQQVDKIKAKQSGAVKISQTGLEKGKEKG